MFKSGQTDLYLYTKPKRTNGVPSQYTTMGETRSLEKKLRIFYLISYAYLFGVIILTYFATRLAIEMVK